ncbi:unnamed protein product [Rhizophagus irregularis]|nr:unnamed protein product [Rhizophagus irregularis]
MRKNNMKKKAAEQTTTPYAIYGFFRSFRESLSDDNDFSDFISTLTITPMKDVVEMTLMRVCDAIDMLGKVELALGFDERLMDGF